VNVRQLDGMELTTADGLRIRFPPMAEGQVGWYLDSPRNGYMEGDNWIARDWFPELVIPEPVGTD
jgi:hypothetical protein